MLLPNEAKRIKLFSISFVAQNVLDNYIADNKLDIIVTRSGNLSLYKPGGDDVVHTDWEKLLDWLKTNNIIIYVEKDKGWEIYKWKKEKSKLSPTKVLDLRKTKLKNLKRYKDFQDVKDKQKEKVRIRKRSLENKLKKKR